MIATRARFHATNADIDSSIISTADAKARQPITTPVMCGDTISLVNAPATTLPFADKCVDRIAALNLPAFQATTIFFQRIDKNTEAKRTNHNCNSSNDEFC